MGQTGQRVSHWPYQYKSVCGKNQLFISLQKVPWDSADSAYAILIKEYATDSLKYASFRINRALNMALMTDNIAVLKEEVELAKKIFPETWKGLDTNVYGKNKKDFFDKCFNVRKK